jgi:hypothetical protein
MSLDVEKILINLAEKHDKKYIFQGNELPPAKIFALNGALPVFIKRANTLCDFLFGKQLDVSMKDDPDGLTGERVVVNEGQHAFVLVMLLYDVLEEMVVNAGDGDVVVQ